MNIPNSPESLAFTPSDYEICIQGRLGSHTAAWFEDMTLIVNEESIPPQTIIRGYFVDQAALYGLISRTQTGRLGWYVACMAVGLVIILALVVWI